MQQLDYWFERHPDGFYKFQDASPDNPAYKTGDSWVEELKFSVAEFRTAFDQIGHRHKSKTDWAESTDPFQGKFYCCYTDRRSRLTFYFRNHAMVDAALDALVSLQGQSAPMPPSPMKPPIHAKSAAKQPNLPPKRPNSSVSADGAFTGNGDSGFTGNEETAFTGNEHSQDPVNPQAQPSQIENLHSQGMQTMHSAYTETTGLQKTTQKPQQLPRDSSGIDIAQENRSSSGQDNIFETLTFPKAEPIELKLLGELVAVCPAGQRQALLDEVEGARQKGSLRAGIVPFARALVKAEAQGLFSPSLGVAVSAAREAMGIRSLALTDSLARSSGSDGLSVEAHQWTAEEIELLPPKMRERVLAQLAQQGESQKGRAH